MNRNKIKTIKKKSKIRSKFIKNFNDYVKIVSINLRYKQKHSIITYDWHNINHHYRQDLERVTFTYCKNSSRY